MIVEIHFTVQVVCNGIVVNYGDDTCPGSKFKFFATRTCSYLAIPVNVNVCNLCSVNDGVAMIAFGVLYMPIIHVCIANKSISKVIVCCVLQEQCCGDNILHLF